MITITIEVDAGQKAKVFSRDDQRGVFEAFDDGYKKGQLPVLTKREEIIGEVVRLLAEKTSL